jgi:predicted DCC family thiol-disulfide oxidoreductase YuxK
MASFMDRGAEHHDEQDTMNATTTPKPAIFYDGGCPLCRREIAHYRRLDRHGAVEWVDLWTAPERLRRAGLDTRQAMARLHVIASDGRLLSGVPGFVAVWRRLPYYRHLARFVTGLGLVGPLDWAYGRFADWRLRNRCKSGVCGIH